jgi:hypothetical protein
VKSLLNEVLARDGWRAGNAITLILQQQARDSNGQMKRTCNMLSADYDRKMAPKLNLRLSSILPTAPESDTLRVCPISIAVVTDRIQNKARCNSVRLRGKATASSSDTPVSTPSPDMGGTGNYQSDELYKTVIYKEQKELRWGEARARCSQIGYRLCRRQEVYENGVPFFGFQDVVSGYHQYVPTEHIVGDGPAGLTVLTLCHLCLMLSCALMSNRSLLRLALFGRGM